MKPKIKPEPCRHGHCRHHGRRDFLLQSLALGGALLLPNPARAASIRTMEGEVMVNGVRANMDKPIVPGDRISTGASGRIAFVVGQDAFLLRSSSDLLLESSPSGAIAASVGGLRLLTGALAAAFGKSPQTIRTVRTVQTGEAAAGIRGTGIYLEARAGATYFCTCYGKVELSDQQNSERKTVTSTNHNAYFIYSDNSRGTKMVSAPLLNHRNDELIMLEALVGRTCPLKPMA